MKGVNRFIGVGTCGQDPETRSLPNGDLVASVSIAVNESWIDKQSNQKQERTEWISLIFFGKLAGIVQQYVKKGGKIYVEGKLRTRSWEKDNVTHYRTEVVVGEMQLLDSRNGGPAAVQSNDAPRQQQSASQQQRSPASQPQNNPADDFGFSDDLPFASHMKGYEYLV
jgi:single-strand DNA-binding protein